MNDRRLFIDVAKGMALLFLVLVVCGKTMGGGAILVAGAAFVMAITGRIGWLVMNLYIVHKDGITGVVLGPGSVGLNAN